MAGEEVRITLTVDDQASPALDKVSGSAGKLKGQTDGLSGSFKGLTDTTRAISPQMAEMTQRLGGAISALTKLSGPAGLAVGAAAGFAAIGASAVVAWRAMRDLTLEAERNAKGLQKLGLITREEAAAIEKSADAHRMWATVLDTVGARAAAAASSGFERFTIGISAVALALSGVPWEQVKADLRAIKEGAEDATVAFTSLDGSISHMTEATFREIEKAVEEEEARREKAAAEAMRLAKEKADAERKAAEEMAAIYDDFFTRLGEEQHAAWEREQALMADKLAAKRADAEAELAIRRDLIDQSEKANEKTHAKTISVAEQEAASLQTIGLQTAEILGGLLADQFKNEKASALLNIAIQTAFGIVKAVASNPPPSPLGIAGGIAVAAIGATQAAIVAGTDIPRRHVGGTVPDSAPRVPGGGDRERMIVANVGETLRTAEQEAARGGATTVLVQIGDKMIDAATGRALKRVGSPLHASQMKGRAGQLRYRTGV